MTCMSILSFHVWFYGSFAAVSVLAMPLFSPFTVKYLDLSFWPLSVHFVFKLFVNMNWYTFLARLVSFISVSLWSYSILLLPCLDLKANYPLSPWPAALGAFSWVPKAGLPMPRCFTYRLACTSNCMHNTALPKVNLGTIISFHTPSLPHIC